MYEFIAHCLYGERNYMPGDRIELPPSHRLVQEGVVKPAVREATNPAAKQARKATRR